MARWNADVWGEDYIEAIMNGHGVHAAEPAGLSGSRDVAAHASAPSTLQEVLAPAVSVAAPQAGRVAPLRALALGFLGRHVDSLVLQLGSHLAHLPADVKACLLCVARRRGVLSNRVLLALADEGWTFMDLAGAAALTARALRHALLRCPRLRALDLTGLSCPSPTLLRELPQLCPSLELLAVGGNKAQESAMLEVLPELLPHMRVGEQTPEAVQDSWEDAVPADGSPLPDPGIACGLQRLKLLVWPHRPPLVQHIVRTVNPRVAVVEALPPHAKGGYGAGGHGRAAIPSSSESQPRSLSPPTAVKRCLGDASRRPGASPANRSGSGAPRSGSGCASQPGIQIIRVRKPEGLAADGGAGARASTATGRGGPGSGVVGAGGVGGVGRYTAPHLRQQQQRQSPSGAGAGPERADAEAAGQRAGAPGGVPEAVAAPRPLVEGLPVDAHRPGQAVPFQAAEAQQQHPHPHQNPSQQHSHPQRQLQQQHHQQQQSDGLTGERPQLDDCLAALVAGEAWEGLGGGGDEREREEELHIAEKFRRAYEEQDARLRAKALREAAAAQRHELRTSGAARALAHWLDQE